MAEVALARPSAGGAASSAKSDVGGNSWIPLLTANGQAGKRPNDGILDSILHRKNFLTQVCLVRVMATLLPEAAVLVGRHARNDVAVPDFGPEHVVVLRGGAWDAKAAELMPEREFEDAVAESPTLRLAEPERRVRDAKARVGVVRSSAAAGEGSHLELELALAELAAAEDFEARMQTVESSRLRPSTLRCSAGRDATGAAVITATDQRIPGPRTGSCTVVPPERRGAEAGNEASVVFCVGSVLHALAFVGARDRRTHVPPPSAPVAALINATRAPSPAARPTLAEVAAHPVLAVAHEFLGLPSQDAFVSLVQSIAQGKADLTDLWWRRVQNPPRPGQQVPVGKVGGRHKPTPPPRPEYGSMTPPRSGSRSSSSSSSSARGPLALPTSVAAYARSSYSHAPTLAPTIAGGGFGPYSSAGGSTAARRSSRIRVRAPGPLALDALLGTSAPEAGGQVGGLRGAPSGAIRRTTYTARTGSAPPVVATAREASSSALGLAHLAHNTAVADALDTFVPSEGSDIFRADAGGAFAPHDPDMPFPSRASSSAASSLSVASAAAPAAPPGAVGLVAGGASSLPLGSPAHGGGLGDCCSDDLLAPPGMLDGDSCSRLATVMATTLGFGSSRGGSMAGERPGFCVASSPAPAATTPPVYAHGEALLGAGARRAEKRGREPYELPVDPDAVPAWSHSVAPLAVAAPTFSSSSSSSSSSSCTAVMGGLAWAGMPVASGSAPPVEAPTVPGYGSTVSQPRLERLQTFPHQDGGSESLSDDDDDDDGDGGEVAHGEAFLGVYGVSGGGRGLCEPEMVRMSSVDSEW